MGLRFVSTMGGGASVSLSEALLSGQAPDGGLFVPAEVPRLRQGWEASQGSFAELAVDFLWPYCEGTFSRGELADLCASAYDFAVPLEEAGAGRWVLRLDRGPTGSFKDFAARFLARAVSMLLARRGETSLVLTATSGDTGSAVGHAFRGVAGVKVLILFPRAEVSERQRKQMTTLGANVRALGVDSSFDGCQELVKAAFADPSLAPLRLCSANSINIGRLLPQAVYYLFAARALRQAGVLARPRFAVPCGNFGNLAAALLAQRAGFAVRRFVVATNANDEVPRYLSSGAYHPLRPSRPCLSNAMNVGHPSNWARIMAWYGGHMLMDGRVVRAADLAALRRDLFAVAVDDGATMAAMRAAWQGAGVVLEPHGAVAWEGLTRYLAQASAEAAAAPAVVLATAHPAKFPELVAQATGRLPEAPAWLQQLDAVDDAFAVIAPEAAALHEALWSL